MFDITRICLLMLKLTRIPNQSDKLPQEIISLFLQEKLKQTIPVFTISGAICNLYASFCFTAVVSSQVQK